MRHRWRLVVAALGLTLLPAGCGSAPARAGGPGAARPRSHSPSPTASSSPSVQARLVRSTALPGGGDGPSGSLRTTGTAAVALTFDDGPSPVWTPKVLALLKRHHLHATFCLIGEQVKEYPKLVARIVAGGHTLCNHSWDHDEFMSQRSTKYIRSELTRTDRAIRKAAPGATVRYYRQPGGNWSKRIVRVSRQLGMAPLGWSVDPSDWKRPPTSSIIANVKSNTGHGSIVLMHDGGGDRSHTYAALRTLLPYLSRRYDLIRL
ncbi:polysaccharide deacetylase family protein [Actinocatenispora sera]|uniref:polysaccharide deacetylase family protein n=1 Tax=Actinocatenispora sera TaxID=390989 RepID=UPI00340B8525